MAYEVCNNEQIVQNLMSIAPCWLVTEARTEEI